MGKSTLIVESYPSFNANNKKDKKKTKTRSAAKLAPLVPPQGLHPLMLARRRCSAERPALESLWRQRLSRPRYFCVAGARYATPATLQVRYVAKP